MNLNDPKIVVAIENAVCDQLEASGITADPFRLDGEKIIDAILEHLGDFVLVPKKDVYNHYIAKHLKGTTCSVDVSDLTGNDGDRIYGKLREYDCLGSDGNTLLYDLESANFKLAKNSGNIGDYVLVPAKNVKYFSNDGENYEIHDTLAEAKHEAECAIEHFSERLADQLCDPREDGNFQDVGYGIVLGTSGYSVDHVVTQEDVENGEYGYEVGTEIMSLFLIEAQEQKG